MPAPDVPGSSRCAAVPFVTIVGAVCTFGSAASTEGAAFAAGQLGVVSTSGSAVVSGLSASTGSASTGSVGAAKLSASAAAGGIASWVGVMAACCALKVLWGGG